RRKLPRRYFAEPRVHSGASAEIDVATFEREGEEVLAGGDGKETEGGIATAVWAPARPTLSVVTDLPSQEVYEVRVYDEKRHARLAPAVDLVGRQKRARPEQRRTFGAKCAGLLQGRVPVFIVDLVPPRTKTLPAGLLDLIAHSDPILSPEPPLY